MSRDQTARKIAWVKVTDKVTGHDWSPFFNRIMRDWFDTLYIPAKGMQAHQLVQRGEPEHDYDYAQILDLDDVQQILQHWQDTRSLWSGCVYKREWIEDPTNAYLLMWATKSGIPENLFIWQGEDADEWELEMLLDWLDLVIVVETLEPDMSVLTPSQQAAAADQGGMFHPSIPVNEFNPNPRAIFYDVTEDTGIEVSAGWSPVDARKGEATKLVMLNIEEGAGRVRIELNDTVIHDGTF